MSTNHVEIKSGVSHQLETRVIPDSTKKIVNDHLDKRIGEWNEKGLDIIEEIGNLRDRGGVNTQKIKHKIEQIEKNKVRSKSFLRSGVLSQIFNSIYSKYSGLNSLRHKLHQFQDYNSIFDDIKTEKQHEHGKERKDEGILLRNIEKARNNFDNTLVLNKFLSEPGFADSAKEVIRDLSLLKGESIDTFKKGFDIWTNFSRQWLTMKGKDGVDESSFLIEATYMEGKDHLFAWKKTVEKLNEWRGSNKDLIDQDIKKRVDKMPDAVRKQETKEMLNKAEGEYIRKYIGMDENEYDELSIKEKKDLVVAAKIKMSKKEINKMDQKIVQTEKEAIASSFDGFFGQFCHLENMVSNFSQELPDELPSESS